MVNTKINNNTMVLGVCLGMIGIPAIYAMYSKSHESEAAKAQPQYELQVRDLNGNGIPEKFYEVNGKKVFVEIDGKSVEDTIRE